MVFNFSSLEDKRIIIDDDVEADVLTSEQTHIFLDKSTFSRYFNRIIVPESYSAEEETFCEPLDPVYESKDMEYNIALYMCDGTPESVLIEFDYEINVYTSEKPDDKYIFADNETKILYFIGHLDELTASDVQVYDKIFEYVGTATDYQGELDCSGNPDPEVSNGMFYVVTEPGRIGGDEGLLVYTNNLIVYNDGWVVYADTESYLERIDVWNELEITYVPCDSTCNISCKMNSVIDDSTGGNSLTGSYDGISGDDSMFEETIYFDVEVTVTDSDIMYTWIKVDINIENIQYKNCREEELIDMDGCVPKTFVGKIISVVPL